MNYSDQQIDLLYKLWRNRCFGKGHMLIDHLLKGFPSNNKKELEKELKTLIKDNIIITKPTKHGMAVYINTDHTKTIEKQLKTTYSFF